MDIQCPRCGGAATPAGHEDARAYYECHSCQRIWATVLGSLGDRGGSRSRQALVRVLVVDDSDQFTGLVSAWLEDEGYAAVTASSGRQALDAAKVYSPDIVLLDLIMPPPDGFEVCEALRASLAPQIILMTGLADPDHARRAVELGVVALLRKPFTREVVLDAVSTAALRCRRDPLSRLPWHPGANPRG